MTEKFEVEADAYGRPTEATCAHLAEIDAPAEPNGTECEECVAQEQAWSGLRACLTCGHVGCDDESVGTHAAQHWREAGHPLARSMVQTDTWAWCFEDRLLLETDAH